MTDKHQSELYLENFIQKVLRKNICDILIKTSENREYRKIRSVQITKRKHSYSITEKLLKKQTLFQTLLKQ